MCGALCVLADGRQDGSADDTDAATLQDASKIEWSETKSIPNGTDRESNSVSSNGYYAVATAYDDYYSSLYSSVSVAP